MTLILECIKSSLTVHGRIAIDKLKDIREPRDIGLVLFILDAIARFEIDEFAKLANHIRDDYKEENEKFMQQLDEMMDWVQEGMLVLCLLSYINFLKLGIRIINNRIVSIEFLTAKVNRELPVDFDTFL